jgi:hypothetical protein
LPGRVIAASTGELGCPHAQESGDPIALAQAAWFAAEAHRDSGDAGAAEVARGHHLNREHTATLALLRQAYDTAPETIRFNGYARAMVAEALTGPVALRQQATDLALNVGLLG